MTSTKGYDWCFRDRRALWNDVSHARLLELCPHGVTGDRLWVRERWCLANPEFYPLDNQAMDGRPRGPLWPDGSPQVAYYAATDSDVEGSSGRSPWKPNIHMPRWASRIMLEVTGVRVERLQSISNDDAIAEGARRFADIPDPNPYGRGNRWSMESPTSTDQCLGSPQSAFGNLWIKFNGQESWDVNPWVWVVEFRRELRKQGPG